MTYNPHGKTEKILAAAWEHLQSVPYKPSARWLFYRLLQDGFYSKKGDYKNQFIPVLSSARKEFYGPWRPDSLIDEGRTPLVRASGDPTVDDWAHGVEQYGIRCELDHFHEQAAYVLLLYEANAMTSQFEHYTERVDLFPCGGQPSIPYKWDIAKHIEQAAGKYDKPVTVLYFGDYDEAGENIEQAALTDIEAWCRVPFESVRCGLNDGDGERFGIPENPEKPGEYQWEALDDATAGRLIRDSVAVYVSAGVIREIEQREAEAEAELRAYLSGFAS